MKLVLGILLLVMSIFLVAAVLMQSGKSKRLSGSIAGGAETFFGKEKSRSIDAILSKVTTIVAILFIIVVIVVYVAFGSDPVEVNPDGTLNITPEQLQEMIESGEIQIETGDGTETPAEGTETPAEGTETPAEGTETPAEGTEAPAEGTEAPAEGTEAPAESTEAPVEE